MLTVDLISVHLLSRVNIVIRYVEGDFTFGPLDYVRYIEVLFHTFYCNFRLVVEYRSLNRGSTVTGECVSSHIRLQEVRTSKMNT